MAKDKNYRSTVDLVPIVSIISEPIYNREEGAICIKRDGSAALIMRVHPVDFNMRTPRQQEAILANWAALLSSLAEDCPIQIVCHNKKLDSEMFLRQFQNRLRDQNLMPLRRTLIEDQMRHFHSVVAANTMVDKEFYLIIPFRPVTGAVLERQQDNLPLGLFFRRLSENSQRKNVVPPDPEMLEIVRSELNNRAGQIEHFLQAMGCGYNRLREDEIRQLYYELFHASLAERRKIINHRSKGLVSGVNIDNINQQRRQIEQASPLPQPMPHQRRRRAAGGQQAPGLPSGDTGELGNSNLPPEPPPNLQ